MSGFAGFITAGLCLTVGIATNIKLPFPIFCAILFALTIGASFVARMPFGRIRRQELQHLRGGDYRACLGCRGAVEGDADAMSCSECGQQFTLQQLRDSWEWTYGAAEGGTRYAERSGILFPGIEQPAPSSNELCSVGGGLLVAATIIVLCTVGMGLVTARMLGLPTDTAVPLIFLSFFCAVCIASRVAPRMSRAATHEFDELRASGLRLCLKCRYDLSGCGPAGLCPECGHPYDIDLVRRSWIWVCGSNPLRTEGDVGIETKKSGPPHRSSETSN